MKFAFLRGSAVRSVVCLLALLLAMLMPLLSGFGSAVAASQETPSSESNPGVDLWNAVRGHISEPMNTQVAGAAGARLINTTGQEWRQFRRQWLVPYGGYFLVGVTVFLLLLSLLVRRQKIPGGRSGKTVQRMTTMQRISHWLMAGIVLFMGATGLILLFGRFVLIPWLGVDAFSPIASASKEGHNLMGPLLIVAILLMIAHYIRYNLPEKGDIMWLLTLGGRLGGNKHPKVGYFNSGEKILYWLTIILCLVLIASGLLLLLPSLKVTVDLTQIALLIHAIAALAILSLAFAHVWMARTVEGTLEAMTSGEVDVNWAISHHSHWYEQLATEESTDSDNSQQSTQLLSPQDGAART